MGSDFLSDGHAEFKILHLLHSRFNIFMHDDVKQELLDELAGDAKKQEFIETISKPAYEYLPLAEGQRFIKSHLPFSLLPPSIMKEQAKVKKEKE